MSHRKGHYKMVAVTFQAALKREKSRHVTVALELGRLPFGVDLD